MPLDEATCRKYDAIGPGALRVLLDANVERVPAAKAGEAAKPFAKVRLDAEHACPFLTEEKLCRIQVEHGESYLSVTCATYPRIRHRIDGLAEASLSMSCPEAARLVLKTEGLLDLQGEQGYSMRSGTAESGPEGGAEGADCRAWFWPVREFVLRLLTDREYALWERLFLVGVFVRELDGLRKGVAAGGFPALLEGFKSAVEAGSFRESMATIAPDLRLQLDLVLRLAGLKLPRGHVGRRFVETIENFTKGVGNEPGASLEDLVRGYGRAYRRYYEPFFGDHPHMLENLLVNAVYRGLCPFGVEVGKEGWQPSFEREFGLLVAQFALMKGLLIGVAGFHRRRFGEEHVVQTVQSVSKHFEHHPSFLEEANRMLVESRLNTPHGLTMLIRN